jgi:hypothetical protein
VEALSNEVFFNLNDDDVIMDQELMKIKCGINHLKAMLMLDPKKRINSMLISVYH